MSDFFETNKHIVIKVWNNTLLYIVFILDYIEETKFFLPLENVMKND
jgi:hypothetical protein